jgi:thiol-disulfide isomerase/thioredoxin
MKTFKFVGALVVLAGILAGGLPAGAGILKIGDSAPPLQNSKWVQGEPVKTFDSNHVYIVEFWATWCGPCRASIPHLNEVWQKYKDKDLIVIGQDVWEQDESGVPKFVKEMGDKMTYRVALDDKSVDPDGAMATTWMKAAGQNGIPTAFIVNREGKIAWMGHPMTLQESDLDQIIADKFDTTAYAEKYEKQQAVQQQLQGLSVKVREDMQNKDWDAAEVAVKQIENILPEEDRYQISGVRLQILIGRNDIAGACKLAGILSDQSPTNAVLQNELAWTLATAKGIDASGLAQAEKLADRANNVANGKNPGILDTLARLQFMNGRTNEAVATEQKAVDIAPDQSKTYLQKFLADYQHGKLPELNE